MNGCYYILSFLPFLSLDKPVPFSKEEFLSKINGFVPEKDYRIIKKVVNDEKVICPLIREYLLNKEAIDRLILYKRLERIGKNPSNQTFDVGSDVADLVDSVFHDDDPLSAEKKILQLYWNCAEKIGYLHNFDFVSLCVYAIKLKIMLRYESFSREKGVEQFDKMFSQLKASL